MDKTRSTLYCSNQLERLVSFLGRAIVEKGQDPFVRQIVFLPHHGLKSYITTTLAREQGVCTGIEFVTISRMADLFRGEKFVPSSQALFLSIERELRVNPPLDIVSYLQDHPEKKRLWLAKELARSFHEWSILEPKMLVHLKEQERWKQELWERIFSQDSPWKPLQVLLRPLDGILHVFGFSYLPSYLQHFFFTSCAQWYFLSPSEMFWEDLCTDKERLFLEKKMHGKKMQLQVQEQLSLFLHAPHPLLANWGRVGRNFFRQLNATESYLEEDYAESLSNSLLHLLQNGLLSLEEEVEQRQGCLDDSLFIVSAPSLLREVEVLAETLQMFFCKYGFQPQDVLVVVPSLSSYLPFIHAVFGSKQSPLDYSIQGFPLEEESLWDSLFHLYQSRFSLQSMCQFALLPSVLETFAFTEDELKKITCWCEKAGILWGLDANYKKHCLESEEENSEGTWELGFRKLILGMVMEDGFFSQGVQAVEWTEADLLEKWMNFVGSLQENLRPIYESHELCLSAWIKCASCWMTTYFPSDRGFEGWIRALCTLEGELSHQGKQSIPFSCFYQVLQEFQQRKKGAFQSSHLQSVKFLPLEEGGIYPAKLVYVLGCDEETFPRRELRTIEKVKEGCRETPSLADQDRYLFLQLLLHAREALVFSYQRISLEDQKPQNPSSLLGELLRYIGTFFPHLKQVVSEQLVRHHHAVPFSPSYFGEEERFRSFSYETFSLAKSYLHHVKQDLLPLSSQNKSFSIPDCLDIKEIEGAIKNPLRYFMRETLEIALPFQPPKDLEFFLSPLLRTHIERKIPRLLFDEKALTSLLDKEIPKGALGRVGRLELEEDLKRWKEHLCNFGVHLEELYQVEYVEGVKDITIEGQNIFVPPIFVNVRGGSVKICGNIPFVSPQGLLWFGKKKKQEYPLMWPSFLMFSSLAAKLGWNKDCLMVYEGVKKIISCNDVNHALASCVELLMQYQEKPCFVKPEWVEILLHKNEADLQNKLEQTPFSFIDPYEEWFTQRDGYLEAREIFYHWKKPLTDVFSPLFEGSTQEAERVL